MAFPDIRLLISRRISRGIARGAAKHLPLAIVAVQAGVLAVLALLMAVLVPHQAVGVMWAMLVVCVPGGWYAWRLTHTTSGSRVLAQGVIKFVLMAVGIALVFKLAQPAPEGFFAGLIVGLVTHGVAAAILSR